MTQTKPKRKAMDVSDVIARRNEKVIDLHRQGYNFREIGEQFGMSHEWARQIVRKAGITAEQSNEYVGRIIDWTCAHCGKTKKRRAREARGRNFCSLRCAAESGAMGPPRLNERELIDHLRKLARELGHTPDHYEINAAIGPCHVSYVRYFGSTQNAQIAAGLPPNEQGNWGHKDERPALTHRMLNA